ncbi:hypothetical protein F5Y18DRAFT_381455 [Xylariaceae sp. FL1019]|nr:hypothetical protein F5Y18DRAFT_381455 [Xylariaceae sp. FL1019]
MLAIMPDMSQLAHHSDAPHGYVSSSQSQPPSSSQRLPFNDSSNDSQATTSTTNDTDRVFTPPESDSEGSLHHGNGDTSSQESQLMQLSNLAAQQQKMAISHDDLDVNGGFTRKRMADGLVKHTRHNSSTSPIRLGHSRNTSTVSVASTTGSRISELSAELKAKLSYAMVKVNHGWQSHSIDEVESLASQAASPTSSTSTLHGRHGLSASPRMPLSGFRQTASNPSSTVTSPAMHQPPGRIYESFWRDAAFRGPNTTTSPITQGASLAPPASIQPRQPAHNNPRRHSNARYTPAYLSHSHHASPHTPAQPSPLQGTPNQSHSPNVDPILFSPPQNLREQEALETLLFMSSPGNSANLKHTFPQSHMSQPRSSTRTALPTSRLNQMSDTHSPGRKPLAAGRSQAHPQTKRVEFGRATSHYSELDVDEQYGSPRGMPRRKTVSGHAPRPSLSLPAGLSGPARPRATLQDDDIQRMIDRAAADDSSDSDGEIQLPKSSRRNGAGVGV